MEIKAVSASDMNHMIKVTGEDLVKVKCDRLKKLLNMLRIDVAGDTHYENIVHELTVLVNKYCTGIPLTEDKLRNQLRMLERSPAKKTLLTEISLLTGEVSDELYRVRDIFTRLSNVEKSQLPTLLNRLEREKLIDAALNEKLAALPSITYSELRKLLVLQKPELLTQQINYADINDDNNDIIIGKGFDADVSFMTILDTPHPIIDVWKKLRKTIGQHCDKEKGRPPKNFIHCLIDELKNRGIINIEQYDILNKDIYRTSFGQLYQNMDHVNGSGIWSNIARKILGSATKGVIANKVGHAVLDGASSAVRKRTEQMLDEGLKKKKKKKHNYIDDIPIGGI